jgi:hypothetical protein
MTRERLVISRATSKLHSVTADTATTLGKGVHLQGDEGATFCASVCVSTECGNLFSNGTSRMIMADTARAMRPCRVMLNGTTSPTFSAVDGFTLNMCIAS